MSAIEVPGASRLGSILKRRRKDAGLRQEDLALVAGCSTKFIIDLERGKTSAPFEKVFDVLEAVGGRMTLSFPDEAVAEVRGPCRT